jgi:hypothetical protein
MAGQQSQKVKTKNYSEVSVLGHQTCISKNVTHYQKEDLVNAFLN